MSVWIQQFKQLLCLPLKNLYLYGPSFAGYGFWEGLPKAEICSRLTMVEARHWYTQTPLHEPFASSAVVHVCDDLIERKIQSLFTLCTFLLFLYTLLRLCDMLLAALRVVCTRGVVLLLGSMYCNQAAPTVPIIENAREGNT